MEGEACRAVLIPPQTPTRRRSPDLSAYDRLDPPKARPYGRSRVEVHMDGMDRLRAALDEMAAKVNAAAAEAVRTSAAMTQAKISTDEARWSVDDGAFRRGPARPFATGGKVNVDPAPVGERGAEMFMGVDQSRDPDRTGFGFLWPDGSIRPYAQETFW